MRGKKISSKDREAVIRAKLENPDLSSKDIEKKVGVNYKTVQDTLRRVPEVVQASSPDGELQRQVKQLDNIVSDINEIVITNIKEIKESQKIFDPKDIKSLAETWELHRKRSQVLQNKPTSNDKQTFDFGSATLKELTSRIDELLK